MNLLEDGKLDEFLEAAEGAYVEPASSWAEETIDRMFNPQARGGDTLPWSKTHSTFGVRPGEVSIWAGINGHGKSLILGQVVAWMLPTTKCLIASMEMPPAATMHRMIRQVIGSSNPPEERVRRFFAWTDNRLWIYNQLDTVASDRILAMVRYAASIGIQHVMIDSLMKCGLKTDDYDAQKQFIDRLCNAAQVNKIHVSLVHHMRKRDKEGHRPDKFDVRGASEIVDLVDNLIIVHRNKAKEQAREFGEADESEPDATLTVAKQRHGEWEGSYKFWFHPESQQFIPEQGRGAMPWPHPGYKEDAA